ncbi:MAG TPA: alanine-zipper protein [Steroidobacteraceae bacterium]|nr:alanine-zipper protein [Steroidobacteraceae bacterium]
MSLLRDVPSPTRAWMPASHNVAARSLCTPLFKGCNPASNLMQLRPLAKSVVKALRCFALSCFRTSRNLTTHKGMFVMKSAMMLTVAAAAVMAGLAGCTDLKPVQADIADLKSQVAKLQADVQAAKASADQASQAAQQASQAASGAQSTANQALAAAQAAQSAVDATNEKIDRMFKRSVSK